MEYKRQQRGHRLEGKRPLTELFTSMTMYCALFHCNSLKSVYEGCALSAIDAPSSAEQADAQLKRLEVTASEAYGTLGDGTAQPAEVVLELGMPAYPASLDWCYKRDQQRMQM